MQTSTAPSTVVSPSTVASPSVVVRTLGHQSVLVNGEAVVWPSHAARDLFFLLLSDPRGQTRIDLIEQLWGSSGSQDGNNLKVTRYRLRQALGDPEAILDHDGRHVLAPIYHQQADHTRFQALLMQARGAEDRDRQVSYTYQALSLYQGEYLPDQPAPWAEEMRSTLRTIHVRARLELASRHCGAVECQAAVQNLVSALGADPLVGEQYHRNLMSCLSTLGRADQAITHFRHFLTFIQRDIGDTLAHDTLELADQIKSGGAYTAQHIGNHLPCPRRALYGGLHLDQRPGSRFDLKQWEDELQRGRQLLSLMHRLSRVHHWPLLARLVQEFLAARLHTPFSCVVTNDPQWRSALGRAQVPPTTRSPGQVTSTWPSAVAATLQGALERVVAQQDTAGRAFLSPDGLLGVWIGTIRDPSGQPRGWLCAAGAEDTPGLSSADTELLTRVAEALCYLVSQPQWTVPTSRPGIKGGERP